MCNSCASAFIALVWFCLSSWLTLPATADFTNVDSARLAGIASTVGDIDTHVTSIDSYSALINNSADNIEADVQEILNFLNYSNQSGPDDNVRYYLRRILEQVGSMNDNPWWATNSAFTVVRSQRQSSYPSEQPDGTYTYSFPQFLSYWSGALALPYTAAAQTAYSHAEVKEKWFDWLGVNRLPVRSAYDAKDPYTWFDWQVDAMRSNLIAGSTTIAYTTNELEQAVASTGADETLGEDPQTNALEQLVIERPDNSVVATSVRTLVGEGPNVDGVLPSLTSGSPEIVILDGGTVAGHRVPTITASLDNTAVPWIRVVAAWAWRLAGVVSLWMIFKVEYGYWTTLGQGGAE